MVSIFDITVVFAVSKAKLGSGRLMGPKGVSVDQNGHVIVVDNKACTVFIFQLTGKLIAKFGSRGNGDKQFAGKPLNSGKICFPPELLYIQFNVISVDSTEQKYICQ